jgi:hypothetical protein
LAARSIEEYAKVLGDWRTDAVMELDALVRKAAPKASATIKWAQPVYELGGPIAFIKAAKSHVTIGFWRGAELKDPKGLLEGSGNKMAHVKIKEATGVPKAQVAAWVKEAATLNLTKGDPSKRK